MADNLTQSLIIARQESQQKLSTVIKSKTEEITDVIQRTEKEAETSFLARGKTIEEYLRGLGLQVSDRIEFEKRVMDSMDQIQTSVPPDAIRFDASLPHMVETHFSENLQDIMEEVRLLEEGGRSIKENSKELIATKGDLEAEHKQLNRAEEEIRGTINGLQRRLKEVTEQMNESLLARRDRVTQALMELTGKVQSSVSHLQSQMDEKEEEVQAVIERLIKGV